MKRSSLRDYPIFVQAVADFVVKHGLTTLPTTGNYRRLGAEMLAHFWRQCHQDGGHDLRTDVETLLGRPLLEAAKSVPRSRYADYFFYLAELRAYAQARGLTHLPNRKDLGHTGLGVFLGRHRAAHDLAADLGLPYRLGAEDIPAAYLREDTNLRELFSQFLSINGLAHVPHEQQLYLHQHAKHLRALVAPLLVSELTWAGLVARLGLTMDPQAPRKRPEDYTTAEVIAEVRALCERLGHFPTVEEFKACGYEFLLARVRTRFGKASELAARLGYSSSRPPLVAQDGHLCASFGELRVDNALGRMGVAHQTQRRLVPGKRYSADFVVRCPQGMIAVEVMMFDPAAPRIEVARCVQYLSRFEKKAEAYRCHGIALIPVVPARYADDAALEMHLCRELTGYGVRLGEPELLASALTPDQSAPSSLKPPGYWTDFQNVLREVQAVVKMHGLTEIPNFSFFAQIRRYDLRAAIRQYWRREEIAAALGLPLATACQRPRGYWQNLANVETAVREHVTARVPVSNAFPTGGELTAIKNYPLANALARLSDEQLDALAARLGLVRTPRKRKPPGYWSKRENVLAEVAELAAKEKLTAFPSYSRLTKLGRYDLLGALTRYTPEDLDVMAGELGLTRKPRRSKRRKQQ